jgi:DNA-binding LytR/AlgR family response regulator
MARQTIAEALSSLPGYFIQTHKSYIINIKKADLVDKDDISIKGNKIPIGASFRGILLKKLNEYLNQKK